MRMFVSSTAAWLAYKAAWPKPRKYRRALFTLLQASGALTSKSRLAGVVCSTPLEPASVVEVIEVRMKHLLRICCWLPIALDFVAFVAGRHEVSKRDSEGRMPQLSEIMIESANRTLAA
jgi:hypothetical protein